MINKNTKIIFFDIDGTIYSFDKGMPEDTIESIKELVRNGHIPVICTGRTRCMIYEEHLLPGFHNIVAGAGTYVEIGGNEEFYYEIDSNEAHRVIDGFVQNGFVPVAEGRNHIYLGTDYSDLTEHTMHVMNVYHDRISDSILTINEPDIKISKVSGLFTNHCDSSRMKKQFEEKYSIINHNNNLLELVPKGFNKSKGIEIMIDKLNIPWENTYAFGDSFNDIDMLEYVNYGCAMGNSDKEILERTKYHTTDYDKGGITKALKQFDLI